MTWRTFREADHMMPRNLDLHDRRQSGRDGERGQMLVLFAVFLVVLVLFMGLGIDLGFAYVTKAQLSKAVDAAALAGMSNFYQGSAIASNIAAGAFAANFAPGGTKPGYIKTMPVPSINFSTDSASNQTLTVSATATINTFFIGVLPWWNHECCRYRQGDPREGDYDVGSGSFRVHGSNHRQFTRRCESAQCCGELHQCF